MSFHFDPNYYAYQDSFNRSLISIFTSNYSYVYLHRTIPECVITWSKIELEIGEISHKVFGSTDLHEDSPQYGNVLYEARNNIAN
jgi:hypothetical protein